jgi:lipopolysaccharide transport system permease protein
MKHNILLAFSFAKRDLKERYIGTGLGQFWYILSPLVMIFIYTVIFSDFMKMKLSISDNTYGYSIYLISGLLAWTSFVTVITRLKHLLKKKQPS